MLVELFQPKNYKVERDPNCLARALELRVGARGSDSYFAVRNLPQLCVDIYLYYSTLDLQNLVQ